MTLSATQKSKITQSFNSQGLMKTFGAELVRIDAGVVEISAPIQPKVSQQHGFAHAGLAFAIGDSAAGYAALTLMDENSEVVTAEMKLNFLAPAKGQSLLARGEVVKSGRRLCVVRAEVWAISDNERTSIAILQGTMVPTSGG